ncbi:MAG: hypothetical protein OEV42_15355 [Deltaproteobacteria bacterium]|nr:hypothetical protein [Deltaproteobacteria bacterium]
MRTISFIGSDKNAGKTTALNYVYKKILEESPSGREICITSIGINGEDLDFFDGRVKPKITVRKGSYFITALEHLEEHDNAYDAVHLFSKARFSKDYKLGKCRYDFEAVIEGPNNKEEIMRMKGELKSLFPHVTLLLDGSADRQFLAHPHVSDAFYFALLITPGKEQLEKAMDLLLPLSFPLCRSKETSLIEKEKKEETRSLLFDEKGKLLYHGKEIPFLDENLKEACKKAGESKGILYLNGALSPSLFSFLAPMENFDVILDNLFLYQNVSSDSATKEVFLPDLYLLHPIQVLNLFIRIDEGLGDDAGRIINILPFPADVPLCNLFKDNEISVRLP